MTRMRSVVIADDHALVRRGLRDVVSKVKGLSVVAEAADGLEAIVLCKAERPFLLTLDSGMPLARGVEVYAEVRRWSPETRIIVVTGFTSAGHLQDWIDNGVDGLFLKSCDPDLLVGGVAQVVDGKQAISPAVTAIIGQASDRPALSGRERQILNLVADGHTNVVIGERLGISPKTVDNHRTRIMRKLDVHSIGQLIAYALREGLLDGNAQL